MKTHLIAALALAFAAPATAQTAEPTAQHQDHAADHASQAGHAGHADHAAHAQHTQPGQPASGGAGQRDCCPEGDGQRGRGCCDGAEAADRPCCAAHASHAGHQAQPQAN